MTLVWITPELHRLLWTDRSAIMLGARLLDGHGVW